ncbi:TonB family protein [Algihabitans sp.]|uniref:energy transducer TonB n=1 Tax=Algihabitans sp. TaxID=2821514 RepID=UPI003BAAEBD1
MRQSSLSSLSGGSAAMAIAVATSTVVHAALLGLFLLGKSDPAAPPAAQVTVQLFTLPAGAPGSAPSAESASVAAEPPTQRAELTAATESPSPEAAPETVAVKALLMEPVPEAAPTPLPESLDAEAVIVESQPSLQVPPLPPRRPEAAASTAELRSEGESKAVPAAKVRGLIPAEGAASSSSAPGGPSHGAEIRPGGNPAPVYPEIARQRDQEGRVLLRVTVGSDGRAREVRVLRSSGHSRLDRAARQAVERWRFVPARQAGRPVEGLLDIPVTFRLNRA